MKATRVLFPIIIVLVILIPLSLSAQNSKYYLTLKPGFYSPQSDDLKTFGTGFSGEIALGFLFNKNFSAELAAGYFNTESHERWGATTTFYLYSARWDQQLDVIPVTLTLKAIYPIDKWELYALGGIGLYYVSGELAHAYTSNGDSFSDSFYDSDTTFGGHLGIGLHYNITPKLFLGAETKYLWTSTVTLQGHLFHYQEESRFNLNAFSGGLVIGYRF